MASIISVRPAVGTDDGDIVFEITLSPPSDGPVSLNYRTIGDTALETLDFERSEGLITFFPNETLKTLAIDASLFGGAGNRSGEVDENFTVEFFDPVNATLAGGASSVRVAGVIQQPVDIAPSLFVGDPIVTETDGTTQALFELRLSRGATSPISFAYETIDGSATAGEDYAAVSSTVTFPIGLTEFVVAVPIFGDTAAEEPETFSLNVVPTVGSVANGVRDSTGVATILDDDGAPPVLNATFVDGPDDDILEFIVRLSEPSPTPITVDYRTIQKTALSRLDFAIASDTIVIPANQTTATIAIDVDQFGGDGNRTGEGDENFFVELRNPVNAELAGGGPALRAMGVILQPDIATPSLFVGDPLVTETNGTGEARFEVRLSRPTDVDLTFNVETLDGSATAGADYTPVDDTLVFREGQTVAFVDVPVAGDRASEGAETFSLAVTPDLASVDRLANNGVANVGVATLFDDDVRPASTPILSVRPAVGTDDGDIVFEITLSSQSDAPVTLGFRTLGGTAIENIDFRRAEGLVTFLPGQTLQTLAIDADLFGGAGNRSGEVDENFVVEFFDPTNAILSGGVASTRVTGVIQQPVALAPSLFVSDPVLVETDAGTEALFELRLSRGPTAPILVEYETIDGSATAGEDYQAVSSSFAFAVGQTETFVRVPVFGDTVRERPESFALVVNPIIGGVANGVLDSTGVATILDDDDLLPTLNILSAEGPDDDLLEFVLTLSEPSPTPVTVDYFTVGGTAQSNIDFTSAAGTLLIEANRTTTTLQVNVDLFGGDGNRTGEVDESFSVEFRNPVNARLAGGADALRVTGVIEQIDAAAPSLFVSDPIIAETDGLGEAQFEIRLSRPTDVDLTFNVQTFDSSARAGEDYVAVNEPLVIQAGQTLAYVNVPVIGDLISEETETFSLAVSPDLFAATRLANVGQDNVGVATIFDNDLVGDRNDDEIEPTNITETIILNGGTDVVIGEAFELDGDRIFDFNDGDTLIVEGVLFDESDISVEFGSLIFLIDRDDDGEPDIEIRLEGEFDDDVAIITAVDTALNRTEVSIQRSQIRDGGPGTVGDDVIEGSLFGDVLRALDGDDFVAGLGGKDQIFGNRDADFAAGGDGPDVVRGAGGDDVVSGGAGDDQVSGGPGDDEVRGDGGDDRLSGGSGRDRMFGDEGDDVINAGGGDDNAQGGGGDDRISGKSGNDRLVGGGGDDSLRGGGGDDRMDGSAGVDSLFGGGGDDRLLGKADRDRLSGQEGDDQLIGGGGDDRLTGGGGDDTLDGGPGDDRLVGGSGADVFVFGGRDGSDVIQDFAQGADRIAIETRGRIDFDDLDIGNADGGARISFSALDILVLNVRAAQLDEDDFIF